MRGRAVVQEYLQHPCLLDGLKFDLRVYVLVESVNPPRFHVFREGLARFCTMPYQPPTAHNMRQSYMHLTNYSLNKSSATYVHIQEETNVNPESEENSTSNGTEGGSTNSENQPEGSKRTISSVFQKLADVQGQDPDAVMSQSCNLPN